MLTGLGCPPLRLGTSSPTPINQLPHIPYACITQFVLTDIIAGQRVGHPSIAFTIPMAEKLDRPAVEAHMDYGSARVALQYPPEWRDVTGTTEESALG